MTPPTGTPGLSIRLLQCFADAALQEVGPEKLPLILEEAHLPPAALEKESLSRLDPAAAARLYASTQQALRLCYGHGARGILLRIGQSMWERSLAQAGFRGKADLEIARRFPVPARRRRMLELVAGLLREGGGSVTVHTLDLDLLLADHSSASAWEQSSPKPLCFVTLGLIERALFWATGKNADVEEIACSAAGAPACEFRIKTGGK